MKMTIKEFFESNASLAIHTPTKEQATTLLKAFHKAGYEWKNGESYIDDDYWLVHKNDTTYHNDCRYGSRCPGYYTILNFKDIDFGEMMTNAEYLDKFCDRGRVCSRFGNSKREGHCVETLCSECELNSFVGIAKFLTDKYQGDNVFKKMEVDTLIEVKKNDRCNWTKRYFAKYENGIVYVFKNGRTSKTSKVMDKTIEARMIEEKE